MDRNNMSRRERDGLGRVCQKIDRAWGEDGVGLVSWRHSEYLLPGTKLAGSSRERPPCLTLSPNKPGCTAHCRRGGQHINIDAPDHRFAVWGLSKIDKLNQAGFDLATEDIAKAKSIWQRTLLLNAGNFAAWRGCVRTPRLDRENILFRLGVG